MILSNPTITPHDASKSDIRVLFLVKFTNQQCPKSGSVQLTYSSCRAIFNELGLNTAMKALDTEVTKILQNHLGYIKDVNVLTFIHDRAVSLSRDLERRTGAFTHHNLPLQSFNENLLANLKITIPVNGAKDYIPNDLLCEYFAWKNTGKAYVPPTFELFLNEIANTLTSFEAPYAQHKFLIKERDIRSFHETLIDSTKNIKQTAKKIQKLMNKKRPKSKFYFKFISCQAILGWEFKGIFFKLKQEKNKAIVGFTPVGPPFSVTIIESKASSSSIACSSSGTF